MAHPNLQIKPNLYECSKVQRSQIFKQNRIILIHSRVISFLLICSPHGPHVFPTLSLSSTHCFHHPHIIPIISTSSSHPHIPPTHPIHPVSPCCLCGPHIISVVPMSSPHHLYGPHVIPTPPYTNSTHPHIPPEGGPESVKI